MLGKILCFIGRHKWNFWESSRWGETLYYRKCKRPGCRVRQRWHRNHYNDKNDKTGYWA